MSRQAEEGQVRARRSGTPGRSGRVPAAGAGGPTPRSSRSRSGGHPEQSNSLSRVREELIVTVDTDEDTRKQPETTVDSLASHNTMQPRVARRSRKKRDESGYDDTSQDSSDHSTSPFPDDSHDDEFSDDAIAVDCHTSPSEVIVKGKNVKRICVKFPPHPPHTEERPRSRRRGYERCDSSRSVHRRGSSHVDASSSSHSSIDKGFVSRQNTVDEQEDIPLAVEETCGPDVCVDSGTSISGFDTHVKVLPPRDSLTNIALPDTPVLPAIYSATTNPATVSNRSFSNVDIDWDNKYKQDILVGLEYFERKGSDVHQHNRHLSVEINRLKSLNASLEVEVAKLKKCNMIISEEMDEIKIKLDQSEKENLILQDQSVGLWESKVKAEEMYFEMKNSLEAELNQLKQQTKDSVDGHMDKKRAEMTLSQLEVCGAQENKKNEQPKKTENRTISDEKFELMHRVQQLQDDMQRVSREKDSINDNNVRLRQDVVDLKSQMRDKTQELEVQFKRFLSLKKSFNDVTEENDKVKLQLRGRKGSIGGNSTWPKQTEGRTGGETIHLIDLPAPKGGISSLNVAAKPHPMAAAAANRYKTKTPAFNFTGHTRSKTDGLTINGDNLPPVANTTR